MSDRGLTPNELAKVLRVSPDRIRGWIASGELPALNVAPVLCGKPRFIILPHHLAQFEEKRRAGPAPKVKRRRRQPVITDYYPG